MIPLFRTPTRSPHLRSPRLDRFPPPQQERWIAYIIPEILPRVKGDRSSPDWTASSSHPGSRPHRSPIPAIVPLEGELLDLDIGGYASRSIALRPEVPPREQHATRSVRRRRERPRASNRRACLSGSAPRPLHCKTRFTGSCLKTGTPGAEHTQRFRDDHYSFLPHCLPGRSSIRQIECCDRKIPGRNPLRNVLSFPGEPDGTKLELLC